MYPFEILIGLMLGLWGAAIWATFPHKEPHTPLPPI